jgi:hypothetical protein
MSGTEERLEALEKHVDLLYKVLQASNQALELMTKLPSPYVEEDFTPPPLEDLIPKTEEQKPSEKPLRKDWYTEMAKSTQEDDLVLD